MAWTSSADPEGTFALAGGAAEHSSHNQPARATQRSPKAAVHPLAYATLAHMCGFAVALSFVDSNLLLAVPTAFGLTVSYVTLARRRTPETARDEKTVTRHAIETAQPAPQALPATTGKDTTGQNHSDQTTTAPDVFYQNAAEHSAPIQLAFCNATASQAHLGPIDVYPDLRAELMARVSHELRTPLNAVMGFSDLMGHQMFGPLGHPRYEEYVSHIRESSQRLLKSAEDTLAMTSLMAKSANRCEREILPLISLFNEAKALVASDLKRCDVSCIVDIDADIEVIAHRRALRQALVNVLSEAVDQAADGTTLTVKATWDLDRVAIFFQIHEIEPRSPEENRSLPMCLARTLLELDGCQLFENRATRAQWSALLSLDGANQPDFFG